MATWRDGPRYAPLERPAGFAEPSEAVSLAPATPLAAPAAVMPDNPPADFHQDATVALADIVPVPADLRDPHQPFDTVSSIMTAGTTASDAATGVTGTVSLASPGTKTQRTPYQPFAVATTTSLANPAWAPPADNQVPSRVIRPVAAGDCWAAAYPPLVICLVVAGFIGLAEAVLPYIMLVATPWLFIPRVRFRVKHVKTTAWIIVGVIAVLWLISHFVGNSMYNLDLRMGWWVAIGCWVLAGLDLVWQWAGLRNGEAPNRNA